MKLKHLPEASLHPPSHGDADLADAARPSWVLLDFSAYIADRHNSTTASCMTRDKKKIQVTFFPVHPPRVSYFCVYCHGEEPSGFALEPKVIATDDSVVLLRVAIGSPNAIICPSLYEYYVYQASGGTDGGPSLELLPHPSPYFFYDEQVGILCRGSQYTIVALRDDASAFFRGSSIPGHYDVCLFESEKKVWTTKAVFLPLGLQQASNGDEGFQHKTSKVITIGGTSGTMAFVDLWRGIVLFNVFGGDSMLGYLTLPQPISPIPFWKDNCSPSFTRDIAVVNGRFQFVEFMDKICTGLHGGYINDGWVAATWSREVFSPQEGSWCQGHRLESCNINVDHNPLPFGLLPKLPGDEGKSQMIFQRLHTGHPTLSLHHDDIIYVMAKVELQDSKAWILAFDMGNGTLQGVAEFGAARTLDISLTYTQSRISKHLIVAPGTKGDMKRPGSPLLGSHAKKLLSSR